MKKVLILGAGIYQVPLIKKARQMGLFTIVVSYKGNYPGFSLADQVHFVDTTDEIKILEIAKKEEIDGIVTAGSDVALISLGRVCGETGLPGLSYEAGLHSTNKSKMKEAFIRHGVRTAKYHKISSKMDLYGSYDQLEKPVILKAVDSSGSRGIIRVDRRDELDTAYEKVIKITRMKYFIMEECLIGEEFGAQAFIWNGKLKFIMPHGDLIYEGDASVPIGHYVPCALEDTIYHDLEYQLMNGLRSLHFDNCAINADLILKDKNVYVLEIGGRAGATCLPEIVSLYYGFDYYEKILEACLGYEPHFSCSQSNPAAAEILYSDKEGQIITMENRNDDADYIYDISFDYKVGDKVNAFHVGPDRIGQIIVKGKTLKEALNNLDRVKKNIHIIVRD